MAVDESNVQFLTSFNYQKIADADSATVAVPNNSTHTITITHNLGRIVSVRAWYDPALGKRFPISIEQYVDDTTFNSEVNLVDAKAHLTTNTLVIILNNATASSKDVTYWYRIYYDV